MVLDDSEGSYSSSLYILNRLQKDQNSAVNLFFEARKNILKPFAGYPSKAEQTTNCQLSVTTSSLTALLPVFLTFSQFQCACPFQADPFFCTHPDTTPPPSPPISSDTSILSSLCACTHTRLVRNLFHVLHHLSGIVSLAKLGHQTHFHLSNHL